MNRRLNVQVRSAVRGTRYPRRLQLFFRFIPRLCHPTLFSASSPSFAMRSFATILLAISLPLHAFAAHGVNHARRHADIALQPRNPGARVTFYDITVGLYALSLCPHCPWLIISLQYGLWTQP
jgi:hypothetical protein